MQSPKRARLLFGRKVSKSQGQGQGGAIPGNKGTSIAPRTIAAAARRHGQTAQRRIGIRPLSLSLVRLHGDPFLSQTHLTQALCELRGAYPGRGVVVQGASHMSLG